MVIDWLRKNGRETGSSVAEIDAETDLLSSGLVDSLGFIDLILYLETEGGYKIDLADADPAEFSSVGGGHGSR